MIVCPFLPDPENGNIVFDDLTFEFGTTAIYECDVGFGLSGDSTVRICRGDGTSTTGEWTGTAPTCDRMLNCIN